MKMENQTKKCPYCGEEIKIEAIKCRYCNEYLNGSSELTPKTNINKQEPERTFYEDEKVKVTSLRYMANNEIYVMRNISSVSMFEIPKSKVGSILLTIIGFIVLLFSTLIGVILMILGLVTLIIAITTTEYSVRITGGGSNRNTITSQDKEYIQKIVDAINEVIITRG